jgi:RimJ/RimL family protein N-acetyltransferase
MLRSENSLDRSIIEDLRKKDLDVPFNKNKNSSDNYKISIIKIEPKIKERIIGGIILELDKEDQNTIFINYWIDSAYRNNGFATKAVDLTCNILSKVNSDFKIGIKQIKAFINHDNLSSIKVVENCNFTCYEDPRYIKYGLTFGKKI